MPNKAHRRNVPTLMLRPAIGGTVRVNRINYTLVDEGEMYKRKADGRMVELLTWRFVCPECPKGRNVADVTTGSTLLKFPWACRKCLPIVRARYHRERLEKKARERTVISIPGPALIRDALTKIWPCRTSMKPNTPRRLHAPTLLRDAHEPLSKFSLAEIELGIWEAIKARYVIEKAQVGNRPSGARLFGMKPRDEAQRLAIAATLEAEKAKRAARASGQSIQTPTVFD